MLSTYNSTTSFSDGDMNGDMTPQSSRQSSPDRAGVKQQSRQAATHAQAQPPQPQPAQLPVATPSIAEVGDLFDFAEARWVASRNTLL